MVLNILLIYDLLIIGVKNIAQRGFAHIIALVILVLGIGAGAYLVQQTTPFFSKTSEISQKAIKTISPSQNAATANSDTLKSKKSNKIALGVHVPIVDPNGKDLDDFAQKVGKTPAIAWRLQYWGDPNNQFDPNMVDIFRTRGIMPALNWQPTKGPANQNLNQPDYSWKAIASGTHDEYIAKWAKDAKNYRYPIYIRMMSEMNGNWFPWGYNVNGNTDPQDYIKAWKHIVAFFKDERADNVQFVWCVDSDIPVDNISSFFPGDRYVDWVAMDGYNKNPSKWISLYDRFKPTYDILTRISKRPIIIYEVASVEQTIPGGQAKADWIREGFLKAITQSFPEVKAVIWFNQEAKYLVDTSADSLAAYKEVVANDYYQGVMPGQDSLNPQSLSAPPPSGQQISISGEIVCLSSKGGVQTLICINGLKGDDGNYYGLSNLDIVSGKYGGGQRVQIEGKLTSENKDRYNIVGTITITSIILI